VTLTSIQGGDGVPAEPDWSQLFSDELDIALAHDEWGLVIRSLQDAQTLAIENGHMIERLVMYRVQFTRAAREVAEHGTIMKAKRTKVPQVNPYWSIMRQAGEEIRVLEVELGIPPVRRGKAAKVQRGKKAQRAADAYLKPVSK
jgi:phage terminase small subunit